MKKLAVLFLLISTMSFSESITLDDMIKKLKKVGVQKEFSEIQQEKDQVARKKTERMYHDGFDVTVTPSHEFDYDPLKKDWDTTTAKASYDFLSVGVYDMKDGADTWVGIDKNLKDLIYSEKKHRLRILDFTEEKTKIANAKNIDAEIIELIEHYKKYTNLVEYYAFMNTQKSQYESEYKIMKEEYKLGSKTKLDMELSKVKLENLNAEMETTKDELKKLREDFYLKFRISVTDSDTLEVLGKDVGNIELKINRIGKRDLETLELDKKINVEKVSYSEYDNDMPDLNFSTKYMIQKKEWVISLGINKKFFSFDDITETNKLDLKKSEIEEKYTKDKIESLRKENMTSYRRLKKDINNKKRDLEVKKLESLIYNEEFKNGSKSFSDYIEKRRDYEKLYVEYIQANNELQSFIYELDYKL